jgi:formiminotetrahydrofolate cyclodeaminase
VEQQITENTVKQLVAQISDHHHALAGAVIAISAAQAAALGEACMQISLDHQVDKLDWREVTTRIERMVKIKESLLDWGDQDAESLTQHMALREAGAESARLDFLCRSPAEISRLAIDAANLLQNFRSLVIDQVKDDLEITINLLAGTAQAAMLLLDSNLRIWPDSNLLEKYDPIVTDLEQQIDQLTPVHRIRR